MSKHNYHNLIDDAVSTIATTDGAEVSCTVVRNAEVHKFAIKITPGVQTHEDPANIVTLIARDMKRHPLGLAPVKGLAERHILGHQHYAILSGPVYELRVRKRAKYQVVTYTILRSAEVHQVEITMDPDPPTLGDVQDFVQLIAGRLQQRERRARH